MQLQKLEEKLEHIRILTSLYDKLAAEQPRLPEEAAAARKELKLLKIDLLKTILNLRKQIAEAEAELDV